MRNNILATVKIINYGFDTVVDLFEPILELIKIYKGQSEISKSTKKHAIKSVSILTM
jgi:hypothetical protein